MKKLLISLALVGALCLVPAASMAKTYVTFGTGGTGGTFYAVGAAMSKVLNSKVKDVSANAESTGASVENCRLLGAKKIEFGFSATDALYAAYLGKREFKTPLSNLRLLFIGYSGAFHTLVGADSKYKSIKDLKGAKVASYPGNTSEFQVPSLMSIFGVTRKDYKTVPLRPSEQVQAFRDGAVDCIFSSLGVPNSAIMDLTSTHKMCFLPIEGKYADESVKKFPFFPKTVIPANSYTGQTKAVHTVGTPIVLVTRAGVPDKLITEFMNVIANNKKELSQIHKAAGAFRPEKMKGSVYIPLHKAAAKWYRDKGILKDTTPLWK